jgi:hypothetical protein
MSRLARARKRLEEILKRQGSKEAAEEELMATAP